MLPISISIRQLKTHLRTYINRVRSGETIIITEGDRPIAQIIPFGISHDARVHPKEHAGLLAWSGRKLSPHTPVARARERKSVADLLLQDRE